MVRLGLFLLFAAWLAGCSGGGATVGGNASGGGPSVRASVAPGAPSPGASAGSSAAPTVAPTNAPNSLAPPSTPPNAAGYADAVPAQPATGQSRPGQIYSIYITVPKTNDTMAFTVFEPSTVTGGQTYPLIVYGPGFASTRPTTLGSPAPSSTPGANGGADLAQFVDNGYGVIAFDQRGFGQSGGKIRVMDPDYDGPDLLAILDWAQNKLPWLAFGPTLEGDDQHEPIVGTIGTSTNAIVSARSRRVSRRTI